MSIPQRQCGSIESTVVHISAPLVAAPRLLVAQHALQLGVRACAQTSGERIRIPASAHLLGGTLGSVGIL